MSLPSTDALDHLPPNVQRVAAALRRPVAIAYATVVVMTLAGWLVLALVMVRDLGQPADWDVATFGRALVDALCRPSLVAGTAPITFGAWFTAAFLPAFAMWAAMALAMMLPTAAPMIITYAEIADTGAAKGVAVVSPFVLVAGYTAIWLGFSFAAALAQEAIAAALRLDPALARQANLFAAAAFLVAGLYQFTGLKHACLTRCQRPFPFFMARWRGTQRGVFALGLEQGLACLGCCWALMAVMLALGSMNAVWMAGLGVVMAIEKTRQGLAFTRVLGVALIVVAGLFFWAALPPALAR